VEEVMNSPALLRKAWASSSVRVRLSGDADLIDRLLAREQLLLECVGGDTVSLVVTRFLIDQFPDAGLVANSKSDYPDLFLRASDYSALPVRDQAALTFGPAVRGKGRYPVRVPDGLEVKTSRDGANIDCHYHHAGLHLLLAYSSKGAAVKVEDMLAGFLQKDHYRITQPRTGTTTLKASFNRAHFVSLRATVAD